MCSTTRTGKQFNNNITYITYLFIARRLMVSGQPGTHTKTHSFLSSLALLRIQSSPNIMLCAAAAMAVGTSSDGFAWAVRQRGRSCSAPHAVRKIYEPRLELRAIIIIYNRIPGYACFGSLFFLFFFHTKCSHANVPIESILRYMPIPYGIVTAA